MRKLHAELSLHAGPFICRNVGAHTSGLVGVYGAFDNGLEAVSSTIMGGNYLQGLHPESRSRGHELHLQCTFFLGG